MYFFQIHENFLKRLHTNQYPLKRPHLLQNFLVQRKLFIGKEFNKTYTQKKIKISI